VSEKWWGCKKYSGREDERHVQVNKAALEREGMLAPVSVAVAA
jgi:hypothetical protein